MLRRLILCNVSCIYIFPSSSFGFLFSLWLYFTMHKSLIFELGLLILITIVRKIFQVTKILILHFLSALSFTFKSLTYLELDLASGVKYGVTFFLHIYPVFSTSLNCYLYHCTQVQSVLGSNSGLFTLFHWSSTQSYVTAAYFNY